MPRKAVYILVTKHGATFDQQMALIRKTVKLGKSDEVYTDDTGERYRRKDTPLRQRELALQHMRRGDTLVVASPGGLGIGREDIRGVLQQLAHAGHDLLDASSGKTVRWSEEVADAVEFLDRAVLERKRGAAENARQAKMALGYTYVPEPKPLAVTEAHARQMWYDRVRYPSQAEVAEACGVSARTLYNRFGPRVPATPLQRRKRR